MILAVGGLLPWLSPNSFYVLERTFPRFFRSPPHALAASVPWALWIYFIFSQLFQRYAPQENITRQDVHSFANGAIQYSFLLVRQLIRPLCWAVLCSLLFFWAHEADLDQHEIVTFQWRVASTQLLVNVSAMWPIPYAIFHRFPHPNVLPAEAPFVNNQHPDRNQTPFVCSINIHQ